MRVGPLEPAFTFARLSPPGGSGAALRRPCWEFESPRGDQVHLVRYASGKRGGCLPLKASSILVRTAHDARQGIPISRGRRLRPGVLQVQVLSLVRRARSTTVVQPLDKRPTRGPTPPSPTRQLFRDPRARHAGSDPAARRFESVSRDPHARLAQLAEATCSNQVCSEFESPGAHETSREPTVFGYPLLTGRCGFESRRAKARSSTAEHHMPSTPHCSRAFLWGGRRDGALPCKQRVAGLTPALSTGPAARLGRALAF